MGIAYEVDKQQALMTIVWDGAITAADWRAHLEATFADPDWPAVARNLTDLRSADVSAISESDRAEIVALYRPHADKIRGKKSAVVAGDNFDVSRRFESRNEPEGMRLIVFNDLFNACTWLGIDIPEAQATVNGLRTGIRTGAADPPDAGSVPRSR